MVKSSIMYKFGKKKDLLRFLMLVVVGLCLIQTRDCRLVEVRSVKTTIPTVECEVIGNIDWDGFIYDLMEDIQIIEIKPKG